MGSRYVGRQHSHNAFIFVTLLELHGDGVQVHVRYDFAILHTGAVRAPGSDIPTSASFQLGDMAPSRYGYAQSASKPCGVGLS